MDHKELIERLRTDAEWAEGQEWETPICLLDDLREAISIVAELKRERDTAMKETERMKSIMREHRIMLIPTKYPGGKSVWNTPPRGTQKEE